jgi:hypothetical protein
MHSIIETPTFSKRAKALLSEAEYFEIITALSQDPWAGDEIVGTHGVRKRRFGARGKGKSGGACVIYYVYDESIPVYALLIYGKSERADLTADERKAAAAFALQIKAAAKSRIHP